VNFLIGSAQVFGRFNEDFQPFSRTEVPGCKTDCFHAFRQLDIGRFPLGNFIEIKSFKLDHYTGLKFSGKHFFRMFTGHDGLLAFHHLIIGEHLHVFVSQPLCLRGWIFCVPAVVGVGWKLDLSNDGNVKFVKNQMRRCPGAMGNDYVYPKKIDYFLVPEITLR
jgi:hypothetical protein